MTARRPDQPSTIAESGAAAGPRRAKLSPVDDDFAPRTVTDDEFVDFLLAVQTGFGNTVHDDLDEYPAHLLTPDRALAVRDGGTSGGAVVATAGSYAFEVTVPGGAQLPIAGVSMVTVHPTHRRRGILRRMMTAQLDDVARRGEPLAGLTASEASIYPRFGYGAATFTTRWELESHHAQLLETRPEQDAATGGRVRIVDATAGAAAAHAVYSPRRTHARRRARASRGVVAQALHAHAARPALLHRGARRRRRHHRCVRPLRDRRTLARRSRRQHAACGRGAGRRRRRSRGDVVVPVRHRPGGHDHRERTTGRRSDPLAAAGHPSTARARAARPPLGARPRRRARAVVAHLRERRRAGARAGRRVPSRQRGVLARRRRTRRGDVLPHRPRRRSRALGCRPRRAVARWRAGVDARSCRPRPRAHVRCRRRGDRAFLAHPSPWCTTHF